MRRLVLVLMAFALLCQGAWAGLGAEGRCGCCCGVERAAPARIAQHRADQAVAHDATGHCCDASKSPCDDSACHCQVPGLTGLPVELAASPVAAPGVIVAGVYLRHVPQHVPDRPLRPPHRAAA